MKVASVALGSIIVGFFFLNFGLAAVNASVPYVNLPWGMSGGGQAPRNILMFAPADLVGKAPPEGARTIPLDVFQDLEGGYWNGAPNTQYRDPAEKQTLEQLWKEVLSPSGPTPKGVALDLWATKQAELKARGITSSDQLLRIFQSDPKRSQQICLDLKAGFYVTSTAGSGPSAFVVTVGFKPYSDTWDLRVVNAGVVSSLMEGVRPEWIIESLEAGGYTKEYAKQVLQEALATHGTSFKPDVNWKTGNLDELWATDKYGSPTTAPVVHSVTEPTWMMVTQDMLNQAGGKIVLPGGQVMAKPGFASFNGIPNAQWFRDFKIPIGEMMGGRQLTLYVDGRYLEYVTDNSGVTSAKSSIKKDIWDIAQKSSIGFADPRVLADYAKWCIDRGETWKMTGYSPLPPSATYAKYGIDPSSYAPSPATAELDLFMVSFIPEGQKGGLSKADASIVQRHAMQCPMVTDETYAKMKNEGLKVTIGGKVYDVSQVISTSELVQYEVMREGKFIGRLDKFAIESGAIKVMTRQETQKYVDTLNQLETTNPAAKDLAKRLANAWNKNAQAWSGFAERHKKTNPDALSMVDEYCMISAGYEWSGTEWVFKGVTGGDGGDVPPPEPQSLGFWTKTGQGSTYYEPSYYDLYSWLKVDLKKPSSRITSLQSSTQVFSWLSGAGFKVGQNWAVYLPRMGSERPLTNVNQLRNLRFTLALFSPDYSHMPSRSFTVLGSSQVPFTGVSVDRAWWIALVVGCALIIAPMLDTKKLAQKMR